MTRVRSAAARVAGCVLGALAVAGPAWGGQEPPPSPEPEPAAGTYAYNPEGRRDPFVSLLARGLDPGAGSPTGTGLNTLAADDLTVRGIVQSRGGYVAMIQAPDMRTYIVRANDQLLDGRITAITARELVITQEVNDPLSLVKQREVRKPLRPSEEGR